MTDPLHHWREHARQQFRRHGLPETHQELWKYTDLASIHDTLGSDWRKGSASDAEAELPASLPQIDGLDAIRIVIWQGHVHPCSDDLPTGMNISTWSAMDEQSVVELVPLCDEHDPLFHAFDPLNANLMQDGLCLRMAAGVQLERPLLVLHVHDAHAHSHVRHCLHLGVGAKIDVIAHDVGIAGDTACLRSSHWHVHLEAQASCRFSRIQQLHDADWSMARLRVTQQAESHFSAHSVELGAALSRCDTTITLAGEGAQGEAHGLMLLNHHQHVDHHIHIAHQAAHCRSAQQYRSVLDGHSRAVYNGAVHVHAHASGSDATQHSDNLLLSRHAEVDTKPELEIDHDDVSCAHGATVGQLDTQQLFYLRSRGISEQMSRDMLVFAFADTLLADLPQPEVRRYVEQYCFDKLPHSDAMPDLLALQGVSE